jgi:quercetin dioxygenase-like cupin family protein
MRITRRADQAFRPYGGPGITKAEFWRGKHDVTFELFDLKQGADYPEHIHDCWEAMFVVSGRINLSGEVLEAGDFVFTEPGETHIAKILADSIVLLGFGKTYS